MAVEVEQTEHVLVGQLVDVLHEVADDGHVGRAEQVAVALEDPEEDFQEVVRVHEASADHAEDLLAEELFRGVLGGVQVVQQVREEVLDLDRGELALSVGLSEEQELEEVDEVGRDGEGLEGGLVFGSPERVPDLFEHAVLHDAVCELGGEVFPEVDEHEHCVDLRVHRVGQHGLAGLQRLGDPGFDERAALGELGLPRAARRDSRAAAAA